MTNRAAFHRAQHIGKPVIGRGKTWLRFDNGDGSSTSVFTIAPLHKGNGSFVLSDEIDTAWVSRTGAWDWEYTSAGFQAFARNIFNAGDLFQFADPVSGASINFDPQSLNWLDRVTFSRQQIAIKQAVAAQASDYILNFPNGWGSGRHFRYEATSKALRKIVTIDSAASLPTPTVSNPWLELEFSLSSSNCDFWLDGVKWQRVNNIRVITTSRIEIRSLDGSQVLWYLSAPVANDAKGKQITGEMEVRRAGGPGALFITIRIPKTWIDAAIFPIEIDPSTDFYAGAGDGQVLHEGTVWATVHDAVDGTTADYTGAVIRPWSRYEDPTYGIQRAFLPIDTAAIPDTDVISAATLNVYVINKSDGDNDGDDWFTVVQGFQASTPALVTTDFDQCGDAISNPTEGIDTGERKDITGISTSAYLQFALNATGRGWISKTGFTLLGLREGHDVINSAIATGADVWNRITIGSSEATGTATDPFLTVVYAPGVYPLPGLQLNQAVQRASVW